MAVPEDGSRIVAGTWKFDYLAGSPESEPAPFGIYCFDAGGRPLWEKEYDGAPGFYWVGISGDGRVAAAGGRIENEQSRGILRAYDVSTGNQILDFSGKERFSSLALSYDGSVLAAAADQLYLFKKNGVFSKPPMRVPLISSRSAENRSEAIAIDRAGRWFVAGDHAGMTYLVMNQPGVPVSRYLAGKCINCVAVSAMNEYFVAGDSKGTLSFFSRASMTSSGPLATYGIGKNIRWVALSDDGKFLTAAVNEPDDSSGEILAFSFDGKQLHHKWTERTLRGPNTSSIDGAAKYVTVADGYDPRGPKGDTKGNYYVFDAKTGSLLWSYGTDQVNWPMFISRNGARIVAGCDDGNVFDFLP